MPRCSRRRRSSTVGTATAPSGARIGPETPEPEVVLVVDAANCTWGHAGNDVNLATSRAGAPLLGEAKDNTSAAVGRIRLFED
jgi:fumarylacetoacetate (FAA) hydrolase family protein